jgi:CubicO group peptidase (beta-lactamase class C family)
MVTRRDALIFGLAGPLLAACGGGGEDRPADRGPGGDEEAVIRTNVASDDWPTATPESQSIGSLAVGALMASAERLPMMRSMLVVRNGMLVAERYFNNALASDLQHVRSVTKTVSSMLVGRAIEDGKLSSVSSTLSQLLPAELAQVPNSVVGNITLRKVLQMRSGLRFDDGANWDTLFHGPNLTRVALGLPFANTSGWNYDSATSHLPSPIVANAYGEANALAVARRTLFAPLGIKEVAWSQDASGSNQGSFGLQMRSRDMAKLGVMALDGKWQGRTLLSPDYLLNSLSNHAALGTDGAMTDVGYGYLWWTGMLGGHRIWTAWGHGGQYIMLVQDLNMVIVTTSKWNLGSDVAGSNARAATSIIGTFLAGLWPS